jgi:hypothetical protein
MEIKLGQDRLRGGAIAATCLRIARAGDAKFAAEALAGQPDFSAGANRWENVAGLASQAAAREAENSK